MFTFHPQLLEQFTAPFGIDFQMWQSVDTSLIKYFMVNNCGIQFDSQVSPLSSVVTRDTITCSGSKNQSIQYPAFSKGALSVRGDRSVAKITIPINETHNYVTISMDVIFLLPTDVSDAIFKIYYDESSGTIYSTQCGFFTDTNNKLTCNLVDQNKFNVKFLHINISFYHSCDELEVILEFVAKWQDSSTATAQQQSQPIFFMTNFTVFSSQIPQKGSTQSTTDLKFITETKLFFSSNDTITSINQPQRCSGSFDPMLINFNLFSMQGVPDPIMSTDLFAMARIYSLRCCKCFNQNNKLPKCSNTTWMRAQLPTISDRTQSYKFLVDSSWYNSSWDNLTQSNLTSFSQAIYPPNIQSYTSHPLIDNDKVYFTYHIYCDLEEYSQQNQYNRFDIQYLAALVNNNFEQIFSVYLNNNLINQIFVFNEIQVTQVNYELIFYGSKNTQNCDCLFGIQQQLEIIASLQNVVPSIQSQNIIFRNSDDRPLNTIVTGSIRIIGFTNVTFQNMSFEVSNPLQEDKIVSFLIKPMVLDCSFSLININLTKHKQMMVMQFKFILDEFQGSINIQNIIFQNITWLEQHSFIEFSQSNRFMDKLFEAKSYKPQKFLYNFKVENITLSNCFYQASVNLLTFATSNVQGYIRNIFIEHSQFDQGSNIMTSFSSIEPVQLENTIIRRQLSISNIIVRSSNFTDTSRLISVSLQKVALTKSKLMNLQIYDVNITECIFSELAMIFYNDHSYFNNHLRNIRIQNTSFKDQSNIATENSEMIYTLELLFNFTTLFLSNVSFQTSAMMFVLANKNIYLENIEFIDLAREKYNVNVRKINSPTDNDYALLKNITRGTLININNFRTFITIKKVSFKGTVQNNQIININDQMGQFTNKSKIRIESCSFIDIAHISNGSWILAGSPLYISSIRNNISIIIQDTQWIGNTHQSSIFNMYLSACLIIESFDSDILFNRVKLSDNWGVNAQTGITVISSKSVSIQDSHFQNSSYQNQAFKGIGGHLYLLAQYINISLSNFSYSSASNGGAIYINHYIKANNNQIMIDNCEFSNSSAMSAQSVGEGGAIMIEFNVDQSSESKTTWAFITVRNSFFSENIAESGCGAIQVIPNFLTNFNLLVQNTKFRDNFGLKAFSVDITQNNNNILTNFNNVQWNLDIFDCSITQTLNNKSIQSIIQNFSINIGKNNLPNVKYNEIFTNIHFSSSSATRNIINIINTTFHDNQAGSFFSFEMINNVTLCNVSIIRTQTIYQPLSYCYGSDSVIYRNITLSNNTKLIPAFESMDYQSSLLSSSLMIIQNTQRLNIMESNFQNNTCPQCTNGLIFLAQVIDTNVVNCSFIKNYLPQGGGIAIRNITTTIQFFAITQGLNQVAQTQFIANFSQLSLTVNGTEFSQNSVTSGGAFFITIGDQIKQVFVFLRLNSVTFSNNVAQFGTKLRVVGYICQNFHLIIDQIQIFPNKAIPQTSTQDLPNDLNEFALPGIGPNEVILGCSPGFIFVQESLQCIICPDMQYVLKGNQFECKTCPGQFAVDCIGDTIDLLPGFWRENNQTDQIVACENNTDLCVSQRGQICAEGHSGALCESCDLYGTTWGKSYTKSSDRVCVACSVEIYQIFRTGIVFLFVFLGMNLAVNSTVNHLTLEICVKYLTFMRFFVGGRNRDALFAAVYLKILATHFIVVTLVLNMNLPIPSQLQGIFSGVGSPLNQMLLSQDCLLVTYDLPLPLLYFRIVLSLIYPFLFYLIFVAVKICLGGFNNQQIQRGTYPVGALFIIVYMQPNVFQIMMGIVSCTTVFDKSYISVDTNYRCFTDQYYYYFYYFSLPLIVITTIIVPFGLFIGLFLNRKHLELIKTRLRYGYLILGYAENKKYPITIFWEIVVIYKKICILALLNYFAGSGFNQGLLMLFTLLVYYMMLKSFNPYRSQVLNSADEQITIMQCYIMVLALLLNINIGSDSVLWIGLTILLLFNVYAIYFLAIGIFQDFKQDFQSFMTSHYYGKQCQESCPFFGRWFKQRRVSTNRVRELWKKAYIEIVIWRRKYNELTEDFQQDYEFEEAYTVIEQHRMGGKNNSLLFERLNKITLGNHQHQVEPVDYGLNLMDSISSKDDSPLLTVKDQALLEEENILGAHKSVEINQAINDTFSFPYVVYEDNFDPKPLQRSMKLSCIGSIENKISYVCCVGPNNKIGLRVTQQSPKSIRIERNGANIYSSQTPDKHIFIPLDFLRGASLTFLTSQCKILQTIPLDKDEETIELHTSKDKFDLNFQKLTPMYKHVSPLSLCPFLVGCYLRKPLSSAFKRSTMHQSQTTAKIMKILTHQFMMDEKKLQYFTQTVPHTIDGDTTIDEALSSQKPFTLIISYVVLAMHRFQVKMACIWKENNWHGQITVRPGGSPALLGSYLKQQKLLYVDSLMSYLQI